MSKDWDPPPSDRQSFVTHPQQSRRPHHHEPPPLHRNERQQPDPLQNNDDYHDHSLPRNHSPRGHSPGRHSPRGAQVTGTLRVASPEARREHVQTIPGPGQRPGASASAAGGPSSPRPSSGPSPPADPRRRRPRTAPRSGGALATAAAAPNKASFTRNVAVPASNSSALSHGIRGCGEIGRTDAPNESWRGGDHHPDESFSMKRAENVNSGERSGAGVNDDSARRGHGAELRPSGDNHNRIDALNRRRRAGGEPWKNSPPPAPAALAISIEGVTLGGRDEPPPDDSGGVHMRSSLDLQQPSADGNLPARPPAPQEQEEHWPQHHLPPSQGQPHGSGAVGTSSEFGHSAGPPPPSLLAAPAERPWMESQRSPDSYSNDNSGAAEGLQHGFDQSMVQLRVGQMPPPVEGGPPPDGGQSQTAYAQAMHSKRFWGPSAESGGGGRGAGAGNVAVNGTPQPHPPITPQNPVAVQCPDQFFPVGPPPNQTFNGPAPSQTFLSQVSVPVHVVQVPQEQQQWSDGGRGGDSGNTSGQRSPSWPYAARTWRIFNVGGNKNRSSSPRVSKETPGGVGMGALGAGKQSLSQSPAGTDQRPDAGKDRDGVTEQVATPSEADQKVAPQAAQAEPETLSTNDAPVDVSARQADEELPNEKTSHEAKDKVVDLTSGGVRDSSGSVPAAATSADVCDVSLAIPTELDHPRMAPTPIARVAWSVAELRNRFPRCGLVSSCDGCRF